MKWVNHIAIAGTVTAVWRPELVPLAVLGSTAPDWLEWLLQLAGRRVRHRTVTHYVAGWAFGLAFALLVWDWHHALAAFCAGGSRMLLQIRSLSRASPWVGGATGAFICSVAACVPGRWASIGWQGRSYWPA